LPRRSYQTLTTLAQRAWKTQGAQKEGGSSKGAKVDAMKPEGMRQCVAEKRTKLLVTCRTDVHASARLHVVQMPLMLFSNP